MTDIGKQARDLVLKLLHWNPLKRLGNVHDGPAAVLAHPFFSVQCKESVSVC
jgi:hypothetical protein